MDTYLIRQFRNKQSPVKAPLDQELYGLYIDIPRDCKHSAEYWKKFLKVELRKSEDLKDYHEETFNIKYNKETRKFRCYINFKEIQKVKQALKLFDKKVVEGCLFEAHEKYQYCCCIDISIDRTKDYGKFIKEELSKNDDLKDFQENTFNIKYNEENSQFECYINFNTVEKVKKAVELFQNKKFEGTVFEAKYQDPTAPPDNWINCEKKADSIIDGKYLRMTKNDLKKQQTYV